MDTPFGNYSWETLVEFGIKKMLHELGLKDEHVTRTPVRFIKALHDYTSGYNELVVETLKTGFEESSYNQMIFVNDVPFISHCMHHLAPFAGKMHFGYIPDGTLVGLSKIPRAFDALARRFQIQERLSDQMANIFHETVKPKGCGVIIEAVHFCICARGIKKTGSYTRTTSLRGTFLSSEKTKQEFLDGAKRLTGSLL